MPTPTELHIDINGVDLALFEWEGDGPPVFFVHATGFHARCWDQVVERLPGRHVYALDVRGHGRSAKTDPPYEWTQLARETGAVLKQINFEGGVGVGHSMGGYLVTMAAGWSPGTFGSLLLVDPVIRPKDAPPSPPAAERPAGGDHFAARRRNEWPSPEAMFESFSKRPPFNSWDTAVLYDYCNYGLLPAPSGEGFVLACPPAVEAAVYGGAGQAADPYALIAGIEIPVRVLRAKQRQEGAPMDMTSSPTAPDAATHFPQGEDVFVPQYSHFIPMEDPAFIAEQVEAVSP